MNRSNINRSINNQAIDACNNQSIDSSINQSIGQSIDQQPISEFSDLERVGSLVRAARNLVRRE